MIEDKARIRSGAARLRVDAPPSAVPRAPVIAASLATVSPRAASARHGARDGRSRRLLDRLIAASSLVANDPVLDMRDFGWTAALRDGWRGARDEALGVALDGEPSPGGWRSLGLRGGGDTRTDAIARCPDTAALLRGIPGLVTAAFAILAPGARVTERRGATKGLISCDLGLIVPRDGDVRMRVGERVVRWAAGETLVFDDSYRHAVWNDSSGTLVVLRLQFARPLRNPGKMIAALVLNSPRR